MFNNSFLYEVLGSRVEDMIFQMFGIGNGKYSNSTKVREIMIMEGVRFFLDHPFIGGGTNYFALRTTTGYGYSHNNFIEILCNMGLIGVALYYGPLVMNMVEAIRIRKKYRKYAYFVIYVLVSRFCTDWAIMTHSEPCVGYLPMIASFIYLDLIKGLRHSEVSILS